MDTFDYNKQYAKITNKEENHNGFQYKTGLNIDKLPFNNDPSIGCTAGRLYFAEFENILEFLSYGENLRVVTIPKGERVINEGEKYGCHQFIMEEKMPLKELTTWKFIIDKGGQVSEDAVRGASRNGHLKVVEFLVDKGGQVSEYAVRWASRNGHLKVVEFLKSKMITI